MVDERVSVNRGNKTHATVMVVVDGLRQDHVDADMTPFLHGQKKQGVSAVLSPTAGQRPEAAMFAGLGPEKTGPPGTAVYDPEGSPFRWVRGLGPLSRPCRPSPWLVPYWSLVRLGTGWFIRPQDADPRRVPPRMLPHFRFQPPVVIHGPRAYAQPTLFDLCRQEGIHFRLYDKGPDEPVFMDLVRGIRDDPPQDLYVARFQDVATTGRSAGPFSDALTRGVLRRLDERLASVHAALSTTYRSWDLFVCSSHGMAPVRRSFDVVRLLKRLQVRPGKDYVCFVHPTHIRLWYPSKMAKEKIEGALADEPLLEPLDDVSRSRLGIPMGREWGDRLVQTAANVVLRPDYFGTPRRQQGVHGWLDGRGEGGAAAVLVSSEDDVTRRNLGQRPMVDVFPTLCGLLGLRVPADQEGRGLLRIKRDLPATRTPRLVSGHEPFRGMVVNA